MAAVAKALAFAQDPQSTKLGLLFNSKSVGNGEHIPRGGEFCYYTNTYPAMRLTLYRSAISPSINPWP